MHQYFCPPEGNGNNRSYEFAKEWAKEHIVTVITTKAYFPKNYFDNYTFINGTCHLEIDKIQVKVLDIEYLHTMNYAQRIHSFIQYATRCLKYLKQNKPFDFVYASSSPLSVGWVAYQFLKQCKTPYFFEVVDLWPDVPIEMGIIKNRFLKKWLWKWERKIYAHASGIITLSTGMTEKIIQKGIPEDKVFTIPNGTNTDFFRPCSLQEKQLHKQNLGFNQTDIVALYSGTVGRANGVKYLIEIAHLAQKDGLKQVKFVILGSGNRIHEVKSLAQKYGLDNVYFFAPVPKREILPYLYAADIGIITFEAYPILNTNSANKFFDYLAVGLPVCANYEGWQASLIHEKAGLFAPCDKITVFYDHIKKIVVDSNLRAKFAHQAIEVAKQYDRKHLSKKLLTLIEKYYEPSK
ncbi:MAG: glycosyltransferase family 4 protein [Bacteroidia bacterium]|nr:glycosyltransferase family 4 protein [Bacteroidia bacterium]MDW8346440.1 glycosyltransferase family 4 protein [Bacteroidia bacterium]